MYHQYFPCVMLGLHSQKVEIKKNHKAYVSSNQHNKINEIPSMSVAASWIHLRSQVIQYKWNGTLHPILQIPSTAFRAGWVMDQLKDSEAQCFILRLFCYMWHIGSVRVWTKLWFALGLKQQAFYIDESFYGEWGWGGLWIFFRGSSILPGPRLGPHCACWHAGHVARIRSINVLLAPFLASWMLGSDRCRGRPGWRSVWLLERLGLPIWQDLPSHDGWWLEHRKEKGKRGGKLTALHRGGL